MDKVIYLIFTDLDGTLLDHHNYSYHAALPVLRALQKKGHVIIPNTSKTFAELTHFCQQIPLHTPFIVENGAAVYLPKGFLLQKPQESTDIGDFWRKTFSREQDYWLTLLAEQGSAFQSSYTGFSQMSITEISQLTGLPPEKAKLAAQREFGEPLYWQDSEQSLRQFKQQMEAAGATILQGGRFVHICGNTDKGMAMKWLAEQFRTQQHQTQFTTVALGDSGNDTAMLEQADIAVQIKSSEHPFPTINKNHNIYQSTLLGPEGWAETLSSLILQPTRGGV